MGGNASAFAIRTDANGIEEWISRGGLDTFPTTNAHILSDFAYAPNVIGESATEGRRGAAVAFLGDGTPATRDGFLADAPLSFEDFFFIPLVC